VFFFSSCSSRQYVNFTLVALAAFVRVGGGLSRDENAIAEQFPVSAAEHLLAAKLRGPMLNSYNFGGYLIWKLYPQYQVFIDGRADVYGDAFMDEYYARAWQGRGDWQVYLERYNVQVVVMEPDGTLAQLLRTQPRWQLMYEDSIAVVFQRTP